jgi:hypothetical protein
MNVPGIYIHQHNTPVSDSKRDMPGLTVFCGTCKVPLSGRDQFLGHQMISHEFRKEEAENEWQKSANGDHGSWREM